MDIDARSAFERDGVVLLRGALDPASLRAAEDAFNWSLTNPGPYMQNFQAGEATFYQDVSHPDSLPHYQAFLETPALSNIARTIWGPGRAWYMFEQVFLKEGGQTRRTPWHQDSTYFSVAGDRVAVLWINFDPVRTEDSLEFIPGTHHGPTYNGTAFDPDDETAPAFETKLLPRLPNIQANRDAWNIASWGVQPGDVIAFHPALLHGGAATATGMRRRTLSVRIFGEDVVYASLPWSKDGGEYGVTNPIVPGLVDQLKDGDPLRHRVFPQLAPGGGPVLPSTAGDRA